MPTDPLSQLKDIHLPAEPLWWPPAVGWWVIAIIALAAIVAFGYWLIRRYQAGAARRAAVSALRQLDMSGPPSQVAVSVSTIVRRFAVAEFGREQVADLYGERWVNFMMDTANVDVGFKDTVGVLLADQIYQPNVVISPNQVRTHLITWCRTARVSRDSLD